MSDFYIWFQQSDLKPEYLMEYYNIISSQSNMHIVKVDTATTITDQLNHQPRRTLFISMEIVCRLYKNNYKVQGHAAPIIK